MTVYGDKPFTIDDLHRFLRTGDKAGAGLVRSVLRLEPSTIPTQLLEASSSRQKFLVDWNVGLKVEEDSTDLAGDGVLLCWEITSTMLGLESMLGLQLGSDTALELAVGLGFETSWFMLVLKVKGDMRSLITVGLEAVRREAVVLEVITLEAAVVLGAASGLETIGFGALAGLETTDFGVAALLDATP